MAEQKRGSAMLPLIIVGATLFGLGIYQSTRPKEPEINPTYQAPAVSAPANPRTMQAPDAPIMEKDEAQRAAAATQSTVPKATETIEPVTAAKTILDEAWFQALQVGDVADFRGRALTAFKAQQKAGTINCTPVLTQKADAELAKLDRVTCLAKDGVEIRAEFEGDYQVNDTGPLQNDGEITATAPNNVSVKIQKSGDEVNASRENGN
jgi:hypothetical protein